MNETQQLEDFLQGNMHPSDQLVMEARLLLNPKLAEKCQDQKTVYELIHKYALKKEIQAVEHKLFTETTYISFRQKIISIFPLNK